MATIKRSSNHLLLAGILLAGALLRFYNLKTVPPGLFIDEAFFAGHALAMTRGHFAWVYHFGPDLHLGFFPAVLSAGFWLLGDTLLAPRGVMAAGGTLGLLGCYLVTRELFRDHEKAAPLALLATALLATSYWHLNFSRVIFSGSLVPTFEVFALWLTLCAVRKNAVTLALLAGGITALGFYSYWQYYNFALLPVWLVLSRACCQPRQVAAACAYGTVLTVTLLPLAFIFMQHDMLTRLRALLLAPAAGEAASVLSVLAQLANGFAVHISMLFFEGDMNWRHNLPDQAQLSVLAGLGFFAALACFMSLVRAGRRGKDAGDHAALTEKAFQPLALLLAWAVLAMIPAVLAKDGLPNASRAMGMVIPLQILAAFGIFYAWAEVQPCLERYVAVNALRRAGPVILGALLLVQALMTTWQYFGVFAHSAGAREWFLLVDDRFLKHNFAREALR